MSDLSSSTLTVRKMGKSMKALFVKINDIWCYQGTTSDEIRIEKFKQDVQNDADLTKDPECRVKTTSWKIVNLETDQVFTWDISMFEENVPPEAPKADDESILSQRHH